MNRIAALVVCLACSLGACGEDKSVQKPDNDVHTLDAGDAGDSSLADVDTEDAPGADAADVGVDAPGTDATPDVVADTTPDAPADVTADAADVAPDVPLPRNQCGEFDELAETDPEAITRAAVPLLGECGLDGEDDLAACIADRLDVEATPDCTGCFAEYAVCLWEEDRDCFETCEGDFNDWRCDQCQWRTECWERAKECAGTPVLPEARCEIPHGRQVTWTRFNGAAMCHLAGGNPDGCTDFQLSQSQCDECEALSYEGLVECSRDDGPCSNGASGSAACAECMAPHERPFEICMGYEIEYPDR